jgi:iron(III) transport system permease protein
MAQVAGLTRGRVSPRTGGRFPRGLFLLALPVCALMVLPVGYLIIRAAEADASSWDLILRARTVELALRSVGLAVAVTCAAGLLALPLAWLTVRTDLPGRRVWTVLLSLPLVIPSYVGAFALLAAFGPRGMLQQALEGPLGIERLPDISGFPGAFISLTLFTYPYLFLLVGAGLRGLDPSLEDASRSLGRSRWATLRQVTLPLLRPSIAAGGLLVALYTLHDFGAVSLMRFNVFTQAIYLQYKGAFDRTPAAILSLMLIAIALVVVTLERRARGRALYHRAGVGTTRPPSSVPLGRWRLPALAFCALVALIAFIAPIGVIVFWFLRGLAAGGEAVLPWGAAGGSMAAAAGGALFAAAAGLPIAFLSARHRGRTTAVTEALSYSGFALPGIVVALALVFFAANYTAFLYQSLPLVVVAYTILFLPQMTEPIRGSLLQVGPRMEEAGRALGSGRVRIFRSITAPLISRGAAAGMALVFLTAMKELPATLLLRPTGFETLATRIWTGASVGLYAKAAGPALMLIVICCVPLYILARKVEVERVDMRAE